MSREEERGTTLVTSAILKKEPAMATDSIVIVSAARTPIGGLLGDWSRVALAAHQLGAVAIKAAVERAGVAPAMRSTRC